MKTDLDRARELLDSGEYTCAVCRGENSFTATERGVKPLLFWLDSGIELSGFSAADRVVGRATAFLYLLLGIQAVYARVVSLPAVQILEEAGIEVRADRFVDGIINRRGTGPCPFEAAVMHIYDPSEALAAIREKLTQL